jgi:hypothetical protein
VDSSGAVRTRFVQGCVASRPSFLIGWPEQASLPRFRYAACP